MNKNPTRRKGKDKMIIKSFSLPETLWQQAIKKAEGNAQSLSAVIRVLIEKWLKGEISIEQKRD